MAKAKDLEAIRIDREQRAPEFAKQLRERSRKKDETLVIDKRVRRTNAQEAVASREVVKPKGRRYVRPSMLPGVPDLPGSHIEYVRRDGSTKGDHANLRAHLRSKWEIVRSSELKEQDLPTISLTGHGDCIGNEDTVLMKLPEDLWADRNAQLNAHRDSVTRAVNSKQVNLDVSHPHMPVEVLTNTQNTERPKVRVQERTAVAPD